MAASMQHERVQDFILGENASSLGDISQAILGKQSSVLELVEILGPHLTSTEKHVRSRGTHLLAETLHRLPVGFLSEKEVDVLLTFLCDRIKDHHSVTPHVLRGMQALAILPAIPDIGVQTMLSAIFSEVQVQTLAQGDRRAIFTIVAHFLSQRIQALQSMPEFVLNYIQAMDAEKDPRNLVICFSSMSVIAQNFSVGPFAEEMFEVVGCYFPIDFTPPANDPHRIKREDLVLSLRHCLASSAKFAEFCVPLLLEKLTSSVPSARIDSLLTLAECAPTYGPAGLKEYLSSLAFNIRREVFSATDPELEEAALVAIQAIIHTLHQPGHEVMLKGFLDDIYKECQRHLCEPELKLMYPSSKVLQSAAAAGDTACSHVLALVLPLMLEQYQKHPQVALRRKIVDIMLGFLRVAKTSTKSNEVSAVLVNHKEEIFGLLVALLGNSDVQLRRLALQGMLLYGMIPPLVDDAGKTLVAGHITNSLLRDTEVEVRREAVTNLSELTQYQPETVKEQLGPVLANITEEPMEVTSGGDSGSCVASKQFLLDSLPAVANQPQIVEFVLPPLFDYLEKLQKDPPSSDSLETGCCTCACIRAIVHSNHQRCHDYFVSHVLHRCLSLAVQGAMDSREHSVLSHQDVLTHIAAIIRSIVQGMKECAELASAVCRLFIHGDLGSLSNNVTNSTPLKPLELSSNSHQTQCVCILQAVVCSLLDQSVVPELQPLLDKLWTLCLESADLFTYTSAMRCYAGLLNKLQPESEAASLAMKCQNQLQSVISGNATVDSRKQAVLLWCWLCKALTLRGHEAQAVYQQQLIELLSNADLGPVAADGFRIILEEASDVMTADQHAIIRLMYRQRFFVTTQKQLLEGYNQASYGQKLHFLTALSHYLNFVPKDVLRGELPNLLPLLLQALSYEDTSLQLATVATLSDLIHHDAALLASHTDELLPRLIRMTEHKPSMKVRLSAVKCLGLLCRLPRPLIYPHQNTVVCALGKCLNDHKRLVRREAADARMMWYLLETKQ